MLETAVLIIFTILFTALAWRSLDTAMALTIFLLPTYLLRFHIAGLPSTALEIMIGVVVLVWLIKSFILTKGKGTQKLADVWLPWKWVILLWVGAGLFAVIISPDTRAALGLWKAYIVEPALFFVVFVNVIKTDRQIRLILYALGASVIVIGFVTILQYLGFVEIPAHYGLESPRRATGVFPFPTAVGKFIGPIIGLFLGLMYVRKKNTPSLLKQFFPIGVTVFGLIALVLSVSRGALIGVVAAIGFLSLISKAKGRAWIWAGLLVIALVITLVPQTRHNVIGVLRTTDVSTDVRLVMWKGAARIVKDHPLAGTGLASFPVVYEDYKENSHTEFFPNPDQLWLTLWIEMGLAGVVIFIVMIVWFFRAAARAWKVDASLTAGLMVAMIVILVHGLLDTPYFKNDLAVQFWTLIGLMVVLANKNQNLFPARHVKKIKNAHNENTRDHQRR